MFESKKVSLKCIFCQFLAALNDCIVGDAVDSDLCEKGRNAE
jgi:hypothetical protein